MARDKRSVALFEVIGADKRFARKKSPQPAVTSPATPTPAVSKPHFNPKIAPPPPLLVKPTGPDLRTRLLNSYRAGYARWSRESQWLRPLVSQHAGVIIGVMSALTVIGGVMIARQTLRPAPAAVSMAALGDQIRTETAHPAVLDVEPASAATPTPDAVSPVAVANPDDAALSADSATAQPASGIFTPTARQVNLNYVLVQSYGDEKTATEACNFLNKNGMPCTIEQGVKNWRKDFYLVIGLQGFPRASGPDYVAYRKKLDDLAAQFAPNRHSYKRFDPQAIKWDRAN